MATYSSVLPGKFYGQRSLVGCSPRGQLAVYTLVSLFKATRLFFFVVAILVGMQCSFNLHFSKD